MVAKWSNGLNQVSALRRCIIRTIAVIQLARTATYATKAVVPTIILCRLATTPQRMISCIWLFYSVKGGDCTTCHSVFVKTDCDRITPVHPNLLLTVTCSILSQKDLGGLSNKGANKCYPQRYCLLPFQLIYSLLFWRSCP